MEGERREVGGGGGGVEKSGEGERKAKSVASSV